MMSIIISCTLVLSILLQFTNGETAGTMKADWSADFDHSWYINEAETFKLHWNNLENDVIEFGLEVAATGWIALGISSDGGMRNSDISIGWVDDDGKVYLQDRYTEDDRTTPQLDRIKKDDIDLTLIEGEQVDGFTRIRFTRNKYICNDNDLSITQGTTRLIWAFNANKDPEKEDFDDKGGIEAHTNKGSRSLNLNTGSLLNVALEDDAEYFDINFESFTVPTKATTYYCGLFQGPTQNVTNHIVRFEAMITPGNEGLVHHMALWACDAGSHVSENHGYQGDCIDTEEDMPIANCNGKVRIFWTWLAGGEIVFNLPSEAGMTYSGDSRNDWFVLEIHYDNALKKSDIIDSSGVRIYHTESLRENNAQWAHMGTVVPAYPQIYVPSLFVPPRMPRAHVQSFCSSLCTEPGWGDQIHYVYATQLHAHDAVVAMNFRHIRDGKELTAIDANWKYDKNYQDTIFHDKPIEIRGGDSFILDCWLNTTGRDYWTVNGFASFDEMCLAYIYMYPEPNIFSCSSTNSFDGFHKWLNDGAEKGYITGDVSNAIATYSGYAELGWNDEDINGAHAFYDELWNNDDYTDWEEYCLGVNATSNKLIPFPGVAWPLKDSKPTGFIEYDHEIHECDTDSDIATKIKVSIIYFMASVFVFVKMI